MNEDQRQRVIVAQSCAKAATTYAAGQMTAISAGDVIELASLLFDWCMDKAGQLQGNPTMPGTQTMNIPAGATPAPETNEIPVPPCGKCGGPMWDNRKDKRNPKAPDFKCKNKGCGNAVWLSAYQP